MIEVPYTGDEIGEKVAFIEETLERCTVAASIAFNIYDTHALAPNGMSTYSTRNMSEMVDECVALFEKLEMVLNENQPHKKSRSTSEILADARGGSDD